MTNVTVTVTKSDWENPRFSLAIEGEYYEFRHDASRILTQTNYEEEDGIFSREIASYRDDFIFEFTRDDTCVLVDFGAPWSPTEYDNPALEIQRRVNLVNEAFNAARESYERSWSVTIA
jgi:hypothetical protein